VLEQQRLRSIKPDLDPDRHHRPQVLRAETQIPPRFSQAYGQVLGRPHPCREGGPQQTPFLNQLTEQMNDLQQEVENLTGNWVLAVGVFQRKSPVFWVLKPSFSIFQRRRPPWLARVVTVLSVTAKLLTHLKRVVRRRLSPRARFPDIRPLPGYAPGAGCPHRQYRWPSGSPAASGMGDWYGNADGSPVRAG
jgi:hypothetical protein